MARATGRIKLLFTEIVKTTGEADLGREVKVRASMMVRQMHMCLDFNGNVWTGNINVDSSVLKEAGNSSQ